MKNEKLMCAASACGWFGTYILISLAATVLPDGLDIAATILALWGLIFICADKGKLSVKLAHGGIRKTAPDLLLFALFAGAGLNLAFGGLLSLLPLPEELLRSYAEASAQYDDPSNALIFRTVFLVPLLEETVFRGLVGDRMGKCLPKWLAVPTAALIFAVMHGNLLWMAYAFISGLILTALYFRTCSILPCVAFHMMFNAANYVLPKILPLPDDRVGYAAGLALGSSVCAVFVILIFKKTKMTSD
ncbi:MAG: lysostaphin resistance A-like protein [Eubacteriales bacterium]